MFILFFIIIPFKVESKPDIFGWVNFNFNEENVHSDFVQKNPRIIGDERKETWKNIMCIGTTNTMVSICPNINDTQASQKLRKSLSVIKSEFVNRFKISNDIFIDSQAAKFVIDRICSSLMLNGNIKGYIQELRLNPFGFLLFSELQVRLNKVLIFH